MTGCKSIFKYNKVTQQKKFHLLTLVLHQRLLIKQAARIVGINYSTAKTIMFFNRNFNKSYQFSFKNSYNPPIHHTTRQASYRQIPSVQAEDNIIKGQLPKMTIINTIGSQRALCRSIVTQKTVVGKLKTQNEVRLNQIREDPEHPYQGDMSNQKHLKYLNYERPRTRSQRQAFKYLENNKLQEQQNKEYQSSGLPQIQKQ